MLNLKKWFLFCIYILLYNIRYPKPWLERNKIYFETIGIVTLTIMSILVSCYTYGAISKQTELSKNEHQPDFHLIPNYSINYSEKSFNYNDIIINNEGKPASYHLTRLHEFIFLIKEPKIPFLSKTTYYQFWIPYTIDPYIEEYPNDTGWISRIYINQKFNQDFFIGENFAKKLNEYYSNNKISISADCVNLLELTYVDIDKKLYYNSYNIMPFGIFRSIYGYNDINRDYHTQEFFPSIILERENMTENNINETIKKINQQINILY